jgi:hypothetical protein
MWNAASTWVRRRTGLVLAGAVLATLAVLSPVAAEEMKRPRPPVGVTVVAVTPTSASVSWQAPKRNRRRGEAAGYGLYVNGARVATTTELRYTFGGLNCGTTYTLGVERFFASGRRSEAMTVTTSTALCTPAPAPGRTPPPPPPPPPTPTPPPPRGNPLPDFTFSWDRPPNASWDRVFRGFRYPSSSSSGVCPAANPTHIPLDQVVTVTPAAKRFNFTTNGGHLHALGDAADQGNCNALRTEFSGPEDATHPFPTRSFLEKAGDEAWYGFAAKWPASAAYLDGWDSMGLFGMSTGSHVEHPSYGGSFALFGAGTSINLSVRAGHFPSPGAGFPDSIASQGGCMSDWMQVTASRCPSSTNHNGIAVQIPLLGLGAPRPLTRDVWHDFIVHAIYQARTNGLLEILHRVDGGSWERLYSNDRSLPALIQRAPHPTLQFNDQYGVPGDGATQPADVYFQLYRRKPHATEHVFQSGIVRRQSEAAVKAVFP